VSKIAHSFFNNAKATPEKVAIWFEDSTVTYAQLADLVSSWSCAMTAEGVRRGDHIGVLLPNCVEFVALMLTAADMGAVLVPLDTTLPASAVSRAFHASDVKHIVGTSRILAGLQSNRNSCLSFIDGLWLAVGDALEGTTTLEKFLNNKNYDYMPLLNAQDEDPFILTMTSGSTGDPKPIVLTQKTKYNRAAAAIELYSITSSDRILAATPLYHSLAERLVLIPLIIGGTSILMSRLCQGTIRIIYYRRLFATTADCRTTHRCS
jgi:long-chain acyl-CoA synthetase